MPANATGAVRASQLCRAPRHERMQPKTPCNPQLSITGQFVLLVSGYLQHDVQARAWPAGRAGLLLVSLLCSWRGTQPPSAHFFPFLKRKEAIGDPLQSFCSQSLQHCSPNPLHSKVSMHACSLCTDMSHPLPQRRPSSCTSGMSLGTALALSFPHSARPWVDLVTSPALLRHRCLLFAAACLAAARSQHAPPHSSGRLLPIARRRPPLGRRAAPVPCNRRHATAPRPPFNPDCVRHARRCTHVGMLACMHECMHASGIRGAAVLQRRTAGGQTRGGHPAAPHTCAAATRQQALLLRARARRGALAAARAAGLVAL
jgi:hypothetical protein